MATHCSTKGVPQPQEAPKEGAQQIARAQPSSGDLPQQFLTPIGQGQHVQHPQFGGPINNNVGGRMPLFCCKLQTGIAFVSGFGIAYYTMSVLKILAMADIFRPKIFGLDYSGKTPQITATIFQALINIVGLIFAIVLRFAAAKQSLQIVTMAFYGYIMQFGIYGTMLISGTVKEVGKNTINSTSHTLVISILTLVLYIFVYPYVVYCIALYHRQLQQKEDGPQQSSEQPASPNMGYSETTMGQGQGYLTAPQMVAQSQV